MYTNIPMQHLPDIITHPCQHNNIDHTTKTEMLKLCDTILKENYFEFQDTHYSQTLGLAMGAPTSSILPEIYLQYIEHTEIYDILQQYNIIAYFRYADYILTV
jgi:hypothetical protein